jgi:hypothetical protein
MDDADDQHAIRLSVIEDHMVRVLMTPRAWRKLVGFSAKAWIFSEKFEALNYVLAVLFRLGQSECLKAIEENLEQVVFGFLGQPIFSHESVRAPLL